ncbi:receptor tyrosine-protein kinase let-23-like isoform X4 [Convolutriloba macropyga]|uniref:receptor tyrosine-protein kinase let-23-like isoform X4 n=1 Tax=Convolutriloba macropyga TaxID=536237 RepID=UPI003F51B856
MNSSKITLYQIICNLLLHWAVIQLVSCAVQASSSVPYLECTGTNNKFSNLEADLSGSDGTHYMRLRHLYTKNVTESSSSRRTKVRKCTHINGNLEITNIHEGTDRALDGLVYSFDFLEEVREISGYLMIYNVELTRLQLPNLVIIRGNSLLTRNTADTKQCGLYVHSMTEETQNEKGLQELSMPKLKEISKGSVYIARNPELCYINLVNFSDILQKEDNSDPLYSIDIVDSGNSDRCNKLREEGKLICGAHVSSPTTLSPASAPHALSPSPNNRNITDSPPLVNTTVYISSVIDGVTEVLEPVCKYGHCWGPREEDCQNLTRLVCSPKCQKKGSSTSLRCFGPQDSECCDEDCAAGCWGDFRYECHACRVLENENECVTMCPGISYDPNYKLNIDSKKIRYAYHYKCLSECPDGTYINDLDSFGKTCTSKCSADQYLDGNRCVQCEKGRCERGCEIPNLEGKCDKSNPIVPFEHELSEGDLCTKLVGDLILGHSFWIGDPWCGIRPFDLSKLHLFKSVREITGQLKVTASPLVNLSFLSSLEVIGGQGLTGGGSFVIGDNRKLTHLGLASLKQVKRMPQGETMSITGDRLCYVNEQMLRDLIVPRPGTSEVSTIMNIGEVASADQCDNLPKCDKQCAKVGGKQACWGPGPDMCFKCRNYDFNNKTCVETCDPEKAFVDGKMCESCHEECSGGCQGRGPENCSKCVNFENDGMCVKQCPVGMFALSDTKMCRPCPPTCELDRGCTGNKSILGDGGCNRCDGMVMIHNVNLDAPVHSMLWGRNNTCEPPPKVEYECPENYFYDRLGVLETSIFAQQMLCIACDPECIGGCSGSGPTKCKSCKNFLQGNVCVPDCGYSYASVSSTGKCERCNEQCDPREGCFGGEAYQCNACKHSFYYIQSTTTSENKSAERVKNCVIQCPDRYPFLIPNGNECVSQCKDNQYNDSTNVCKPCHSECLANCTGDLRSECVGGCLHFEYEGGCYRECPINTRQSPKNNKMCVAVAPTGLLLSALFSGKRRVPVLIGMGVVTCLLIVSLVFYCKYRARKRNAIAEKLQREQKYLGMDMIPKDEPTPNTPTGIEPSKGKMYIIQKHELKRIGPLGSGAFGTVYKGVWCPENDAKVQLPVAIKVLQDPVPGAEQTFIDEAQFMASVSHPCLLRLLAICITETPQLVTRLMPHGNLLDYIRKYGNTQSSRTFFLWGRQIAEGMEYLQSKRIVHRDLAARNVLVQSSRQVKITDFGLAQMLKHGEESVKFQGGKVPLKWLALESLTEKLFTYQSDVWSMGVTLWEIFTLGSRPYDQITGGVAEMVKVLQDGERLPQPPGATLDLFVVMLKCWLVEPKSRLTFTQIREEMTKMYEDADRYFEVQPFLNSNSGKLDTTMSTSCASLGLTDYAPKTLPPYLSVTGDTMCTWTYDDDTINKTSSTAASATLPANNPQPVAGGSFSSYNSKCSSAITQDSYVPLTRNSSSVMSDRFRNNRLMSVNNNHIEESEREKLLSDEIRGNYYQPSGNADFTHHAPPPHHAPHHQHHHNPHMINPQAAGFGPMTTAKFGGSQYMTDAMNKVDSPRDDQEFMRDFLLDQQNIMDPGHFPTERPFSKGSLDLARSLVDPEDYLGLNNSTIPRGTLNSTTGRNSIHQQHLNQSYNHAPSSGSGATMDDTPPYINSPSASTTSTVIDTNRKNSRSKPFIPPPRLPLHSPIENYPGSAGGPNRPVMPYYANSAGIHPGGSMGSGGSGGGGGGMMQGQHSSTNSTGCSRGSDAENVFNYEHVPDQRFRQGYDPLNYSQLSSAITTPMSAVPPEYYNSPGGPEDPNVLSRSFNAGYHQPLTHAPNTVPPYYSSKSAGVPQLPHKLVLNHNPGYNSNPQYPNFVPANSNYSPATDSNPATPINLNNNSSPFSGYSSVNPTKQNPNQVVSNIASHAGKNNSQDRNKNSNKNRNSKNYQSMDNNASSFV